MVISHNVPALFTHLSMRRSDRGLQQAMQRLSSGVRINSAREDAAGLAIANKLAYQVGGLRRASENSTHGISLIQTAEGALNEVHNMLQRMRELSVQAAHGTLTPENRQMIQYEIESLTAEIHQISRNTEFNRMRILNGEASRVVDNTMLNAAGEMELTRSVVSTLFVSHQVQPGHLEYTITQAGRPAMAQLSPLNGLFEPDTDFYADPATWVAGDLDTGVFPPGTALTINGNSFNLSGMTWSQARGDINDELRFLGMTLYEGTGANEGNFFLVSNLAGADQRIELTGSLAAFGLTPDPDPDIPRLEIFGQDAQVNIGGLFDENGNLVRGASLGDTVTGNFVQLLGSRGEDIRINIQVMFNPETGEFQFANGMPIDDIDPADGLVMEKTFRTFGPIMLQIGSTHSTAMPVQIPRINAETLGLVEYVGGRQRMLADVRVTGVPVPAAGLRQIGAERLIDLSEAAIQTVSSVRARLGAYQNRLESTVRNLDVAAENTEISRSRIQDTDMARESTRFAQYNVMFQAALSILGQANQRPQQIVSLLQ
ncbi:MAG: hypothetical protein FWF77_02420 [Defluviitaleaceae bacterium]|nr:hypothetical protein [Defluviitaleaceae bacterium]